MGDKRVTQRLMADAAGIARAAMLIEADGLVALPTETVYGLAARADSDAAVAEIYRAKGRPDFNPLIVHVPTLMAAEQLAWFDARARAIASRFWPGPLTLVLPSRDGSGIVHAVTAGLPTIALRCPAHPAMRAVLEASGVPLAAPSANRSGAVSPTSADHVLITLDGRIDAVLDAGPCERGLEIDDRRPARDQLAATTGRTDRGARAGRAARRTIVGRRPADRSPRSARAALFPGQAGAARRRQRRSGRIPHWLWCNPG